MIETYLSSTQHEFKFLIKDTLTLYISSQGSLRPFPTQIFIGDFQIFIPFPTQICIPFPTQIFIPFPIQIFIPFPTHFFLFSWPTQILAPPLPRFLPLFHSNFSSLPYTQIILPSLPIFSHFPPQIFLPSLPYTQTPSTSLPQIFQNILAC